MTPEVLSNLQTLIATTDFEIIKSRKFTGDCPTAYDGQETVYVFSAPGGPETIASCTSPSTRHRRSSPPSTPSLAAADRALRRSSLGFRL